MGRHGEPRDNVALHHDAIKNKSVTRCPLDERGNVIVRYMHRRHDDSGMMKI